MPLDPEIISFLLGAHGGHGAAPAAPSVPPSMAAFVKGIPPGPPDIEGYDAAAAADRDALTRAAVAQNLSRAAAIYRGENAGPAPVPKLDTNVRDFIARRALRAPPPVDDPLLEEKRRKLAADIANAESESTEKEKDRASRERAARLSAGQRDRSLDIQEENAKARREAADAKRRMVSDAQVKAIADYDRGIRILEDLKREKPEIDTGPAANARNWVAQRLGIDDPQVSSYKAQVNDFLAQYIRSISGAATTDKERAFLLQNMPKLSDRDEVFSAKLEKTMQRLRELRGVEVDLIHRQGKDTAEFEEAPVMQRGEGMPPPTGAKPAPGGKVVVVWKGKRKEIPAERLEEALKAGAQKVE